ncbi:MAG: DsrE family protein [Acidobacteria bacterium]|nr:DsrE family protein [Acidobacteriota bacterium]
MSEEKTEKILIIATHGPDDLERATFPFVIANAALVMDTEAVIVLQGAAVLLAKKGSYDHVYAGGLPPLKDLMKSFLEQGGKLLVCSPCIKERQIDESMLVENAEPIAGARVVQEALEANAVLNY